MAVQEILSFIESSKEDREVTIFVSYMEVYNEACNDLLDSNNTNLKVREDP